jgi:hypothetical protein
MLCVRNHHRPGEAVGHAALAADMESLLLQVRGAAEALVAALAYEAQFGGTLLAVCVKDESLFEQWKVSRSATEQSQEVYNQAFEHYRNFVQSLPAPLRAKAAARGGAIMALARP